MPAEFRQLAREGDDGDGSENRLKQVTLPGGLTVNYKYDALDRRIQRTTSAGADERFVYDGQDVLLEQH